MTDIILIDNYPIIRIGIRALLESHASYRVCAEASSKLDVWEYLEKRRPSLAIMDLILGREDGLNLIKEICGRQPGIKILVMSSQDESVYAERVIRAGASGFISKTDAPNYLLDAVHSVLSGDLYLTHRTSMQMLCRFLNKSLPHSIPGIHSLSDREIYVYQMIGIGLTTLEIAQSMNRSPKTIETYKGHIKRKLQLKDAEALKLSAFHWVYKSHPEYTL